jgi:hypothetical protein
MTGSSSAEILFSWVHLSDIQCGPRLGHARPEASMTTAPPPVAAERRIEQLTWADLRLHCASSPGHLAAFLGQTLPATFVALADELDTLLERYTHADP